MNFYNNMVTITIVLFCMTNSSAMTNITYNQATQDDVKQICHLLKHHAIHEANDSLVIYPKKFREQSIRTSIGEGKIFIARTATALVAIKKLYVIPDFTHATSVLQEELRAREDNQLAAGTFDNSHHFTPSPVDPSVTLTPQDIYIYTGTDYTQSKYRGFGINNQLYAFAFNTIKASIAELIAKKQPGNMHILYGLVKQNGPAHGVNGRTIPIEKSFRQFIQELPVKKNNPILFQSYQAQMPIFNPEAQELDPSAITGFIEGSGCILSYRISE